MNPVYNFCSSTNFVIFLLILELVGTIPASLPSSPGLHGIQALPLTREDSSSITNAHGWKLEKSSDWDPWQTLEPPGETFILNNFCKVGASLEKVVCSGLRTVEDLPPAKPHYSVIQKGIFRHIANWSNIRLEDIRKTFPLLHTLSIVDSPDVVERILQEMSGNGNLSSSNVNVNTSSMSHTSLIGLSRTRGIQTMAPEPAPTPSAQQVTTLNSWPSIKILNLSRNELKSESIPPTLMTFFPNLHELDLAGNNISRLSGLSAQDWERLTTIDLSENPLDCTSAEMEWVESPNITLLNVDRTLCDNPPHQNKPKPILQTIHLIKKVKAECRLNCSCQVDYIWEQDKVVYSKTSVNCSNRNFMDFPDPNQLPQPTDTLYLNNNHITSMKKFVGDNSYEGMNVKNLYLDNNEISSIESLESSDWIHTFQVLSLKRNNLSEVPIHLLENLFRQNKGVYFIDLSSNPWECECRTVSTFKVWLLRYSKFMKNIEHVRCDRTGKEIRYLRNEDWCKREEVSQMIELLDCLSIFLALLILLVITKVIYDYWKLKKYGKVPWIVSKM